MAFSLGDAVLYFSANDSDLVSSLDKSESKINSWTANATKLIGGAVVGAAAAAGAAIVGVGAAAFNVSRDTEEAAAQIAASLGIPIEAAEEFADVAREVYGNNFADSVGDAGDAVARLAKSMKLTADDPALQKMTENAFRLRDAFDVELEDSVSAVKTLMDNFGISGEEAFDMIARGYQVGLDRSGDFIDSIGEYSVQFAEGGATVSEFFSTLETGLQGGMLGTDKAADLFKEFRVRIQDGSDLTKESLEAIGIDADEMAAKFADGSITAIDAFDQVRRGLQDLDDDNTRMQAGVGLLGTQFEDLGETTVKAIDTMSDNFHDVEGSIDSLDQKYNTLGSALEGFWRELAVGISPYTDKLLEVVNDTMPAFTEATTEAFAKVILGLVTLKTNWDEDYAGMRTTAETFAEEVPRQLAGMWAEIDRLFSAGADEQEGDWEEHWANMLNFLSSTLRLLLENITLALRAMSSIYLAIFAIFKRDWEQLWEEIYTVAESLTNGILNLVEFIFGPDLRNAMASAINQMEEGARERFGQFMDWWRGSMESVRNLLPFSEPRDPTSPLRNLDKAGEGMIEQIQKGVDAVSVRIAPQMATGNSFYFNQEFVSPNADVTLARDAARKGVLESLHARGMA